MRSFSPFSPNQPINQLQYFSCEDAGVLRHFVACKVKVIPRAVPHIVSLPLDHGEASIDAKS